jgi:hypothetical protein
MLVIILLLVFIVLVKIYSYNFYEGLPQKGEGNRPATQEDIQKALLYAVSEKCKAKGHTSTFGETDFDCQYTEETCIRDSHDDKGLLDYHVWKDDKCYVGPLEYRKVCKENGLEYNEKTGECNITPQYCAKKGIPYENGDCVVSGGQSFAEFFLGRTIVRSITKK